MEQGMQNKEVLVMYDVRGIQNYIFRTNHMKDIVGASAIVEDIVVDGLNHIVKNGNWDPKLFLTDWASESDRGDEFLTDETIQMQVMFIGGGNAYVLFRTEKLAHEINRKLAKYVLDNTYSLNLAVAMVEKTDSYKKDYEKIHLKMREVKARMPEVKPIGAMPFMAVDSITGYPLTVEERYPKKAWLCTETGLKRRKVSHTAADRILDHMVTEKGDSSSLAVVHIDGNNMGKRIRKIMENKESYGAAIPTMRAISKNIQNGFAAAYDSMVGYIDEVLVPRVKPGACGMLYRKIILAGDDITFVCNASVAIDAVMEFLNQVANKTLYEDADTWEDNMKAYAFSACAGIAFFNSHFPFSDAYQVAEECCQKAKARAKETLNREGRTGEGNIGNFMDYQICTHIKAANLEHYREKNYVVEGTGKPIVWRPYYVPCAVLEQYSDLNENNQTYDIHKMLESLEVFRAMPRGQAKTLRNSFALGNAEVEKYLTFLRSRNVRLPKEEYERECWYDALELMDLYPKQEAKDEA